MREAEPKENRLLVDFRGIGYNVNYFSLRLLLNELLLNDLDNVSGPGYKRQ